MTEYELSLEQGLIERPDLVTTPTNDKVNLVCTVEQLQDVPEEFLSGDDKKPLLSRDVDGKEYKHYLRPMIKGAMFILLVEGLERFAFYGVNFTEQNFVEGGEHTQDQSMFLVSYVHTQKRILF